MDSDYEQILMLKKMTQMTGLLHETQTKQLTYWPLMFTHAIKSSFIHDFENKNIIFVLEQTKGQQPSDMGKRLKFLAKCVHELLGDEYTVSVKLKNKVIFKEEGILDGRRKESSPEDQRRSDKPRKRRVSKVAAKRKPARPARGRP